MRLLREGNVWGRWGWGLMLMVAMVDILEYQPRGGASACVLPVIRGGSTRYHSHILNIDTLLTEINLTVISSKALAVRPIYAQGFPSPLQRPLLHVFFHPDSPRRRQ